MSAGGCTVSDENEQVVQKKCQACYQDLSRKCTVTLSCGHKLHRTCLLNYCERSTPFTDDGFPTLHCPICKSSVHKNSLVDEEAKQLPSIMIFGPTGQPAQYHPANDNVTLANLDIYMVNTTKWLCYNTHNLTTAETSGESKEYIQDLVDEKKKLLDRIQIIVKLEDDRTKIEQRWADKRAAGGLARAPVAGATEEAAVAVELSEEAPEDENVPSCSICLEALSKKRSVALDKCPHTFHQSCAMRWFESLRPTNDNPLSCCICRTLSTQIFGDDGTVTLVTYPFEADGRLGAPGPNAVKWLLACRNRIYKQCAELVSKKRLALRDGKSAEWVADIEEEIEKLRRRTRAFNEFRASFLVNEECDRIEREAAASASIASASATAAVAANTALTQHVLAAMRSARDALAAADRERADAERRASVDAALRTALANSIRRRAAEAAAASAAVSAQSQSSTAQGQNSAAQPTLPVAQPELVSPDAGPSTRAAAGGRRRAVDEEAGAAVDGAAQPSNAVTQSYNELSPSDGPSTRAAAARRTRTADDEAAATAASTLPQKRRRR